MNGRDFTLINFITEHKTSETCRKKLSYVKEKTRRYKKKIYMRKDPLLQLSNKIIMRDGKSIAPEGNIYSVKNKIMIREHRISCSVFTRILALTAAHFAIAVFMARINFVAERSLERRYRTLAPAMHKCTHNTFCPPLYVWHVRRQRFKFRNKRYDDDELRYEDRRSIWSTRRSPFGRYAALKMWGVGLSFEIWGWYSASCIGESSSEALNVSGDRQDRYVRYMINLLLPKAKNKQLRRLKSTKGKIVKNYYVSMEAVRVPSNILRDIVIL